MSARTYTPDDLVNIVVKKRWVVLIPFAVGLAAAPLLARIAPVYFRSEALILVVPQQVPKDFVRPTVIEPVAERLPAITDQILSRAQLERIILDMDLYKELRSREVMEDVVDAMRLDVKTIPTGRGLNSFRVGFTSDDPEIARQVTEKLASLYISQNTRDRAMQAENTSQFLTSELENAERRLMEQEKKLEEYRRTHAGQLPSQAQANTASIQNLSIQLQQLNQATNLAQERRLGFERQLEDARAVLAEAPALVPTAADGPVTLTTAQQIDLQKTRLAKELERVTPDHPDVRDIRRTIDQLTAKLESERAAGPEDASNSTVKMPVTRSVAAQQKRVRDLENDLAVIDRQLATYAADATKLKRAIADYQAKIDVLPTRESELVALMRDYSTLQTSYNNMLLKQEESKVATNLERRQIGEQFRLLDSASRPRRPVNEFQRLGITASGAAGGLLLGLLIIALREYRDSSFRSKDEVVKLLSLPVLASIPVMTSIRERETAVRRTRALDVGGSVGTAGLDFSSRGLATVFLSGPINVRDLLRLL